MITTAASPAGVFRAGREVDVPDALAKEWIAGNFARPVDEQGATDSKHVRRDGRQHANR